MKAYTLRFLRRRRNLVLYGSIGLTALLLEIALFHMLTHQYSLSVAVGNALAMGSGFIVSFSLNSHYNFKVRDQLLNRLLRFGFITAAGYVVSTGIILLLVAAAHISPFQAKLISIPFFFLFQYSLNSRYTFHDMTAKSPALEEPETS